MHLHRSPERWKYLLALDRRRTLNRHWKEFVDLCRSYLETGEGKMSEKRFRLKELLIEKLKSADLNAHLELWLRYAELYAIITGAKPVSNIKKPSPKPRPLSASMKAIIKREAQQRREALAAAEAEREQAQNEVKS
jgi:outer membrane protein TolC